MLLKFVFESSNIDYFCVDCLSGFFFCKDIVAWSISPFQSLQLIYFLCHWTVLLYSSSLFLGKKSALQTPNFSSIRSFFYFKFILYHWFLIFIILFLHIFFCCHLLKYGCILNSFSALFSIIYNLYKSLPKIWLTTSSNFYTLSVHYCLVQNIF